MKIVFKLFASLSEFLPAEARRGNKMSLEIPPQTTIATIIQQQGVPESSVHLVVVNGVFIPDSERASRTLSEGDELAIWPPVAGG